MNGWRKLVAAALTLLSASHAAAADAPLGRWSCVMGANGGGTYASLLWRFDLTLAPDGSARGSGIYEAAGFRAPFRFEGTWRMTGDTLGVDARQTGVAHLSPRFIFASTVLGPELMSWQGTSPMGQHLYACRRTG